MNATHTTHPALTANENLVLNAVIAGMKHLHLRDEVTFADIAAATGKPVASVRGIVGMLVEQGFLTCAKPVGGTASDPCYINLADAHLDLHPDSAPTAKAQILQLVKNVGRPVSPAEVRKLLPSVHPTTIGCQLPRLARAGFLRNLGGGQYAAA